MIPEGIQGHNAKKYNECKLKEQQQQQQYLNCTISPLCSDPLQFDGNLKTLEESLGKFSKITEIWYHRDFL